MRNPLETVARRSVRSNRDYQTPSSSPANATSRRSHHGLFAYYSSSLSRTSHHGFRSSSLSFKRGQVRSWNSYNLDLKVITRTGDRCCPSELRSSTSSSITEGVELWSGIAAPHYSGYLSVSPQFRPPMTRSSRYLMAKHFTNGQSLSWRNLTRQGGFCCFVSRLSGRMRSSRRR